MSTRTQSTLSVDDLEVAYTDEGEGPPVVLLHGWPTSSFLYREIAPVLAREHRVVAPDLPGFGASSKPTDRTYSFELYERVLDALVAELGLGPVGLAVHDTGGPIGVHWLLSRPGAVTRLALLNTLLYPDFDPAVGEFVGTLADPAKRDRLVSPDGLQRVLRLGVADESRLRDDALAQVAEPFGDDEARAALAAAGIGLHPDGFAEIAAGLPGLAIPVLALYGADDRILPDVAQTFERVRRDVPHAEVEPLAGVGHFLQEEVPEAIAERLTAFFAGDQRSAG